MKRQLFSSSLAIIGLMLGGAGAHAAAISYNWDNNGTVGGAGAGSGPIAGAFAGVVSVDYWYNSFPDNPNTDLVDDSGNATTMDIGWFSANGTFSVTGSHPGVDGGGTWNSEMLNGYLNSGGGPVVGVTLSQIPYDKYNVYVYFNADVVGREGTILGQERDVDTDPFINQATYYFSTNAVIDSFVQATATSPTDPGDGDTADGDDPGANYAVFRGTLDIFNVETQIPNFGGIAAIQVVEIPEPTSLALCGLLGLVGLCGRRHAR